MTELEQAIKDLINTDIDLAIEAMPYPQKIEIRLALSKVQQSLKDLPSPDTYMAMTFDLDQAKAEIAALRKENKEYEEEVLYFGERYK